MTEREEQPLVSIGLPVFNGEPYLTQAIQSILNQTYRNFELIIYDNHSSDRTAEIRREFAASELGYGTFVTRRIRAPRETSISRWSAPRASISSGSRQT